MTNRHTITIIVACAQDGAIGRAGDMPFRISDDLRRFKQITLGHPLIMGRKTFESLPGVLPGRTNIVVSRNPGYAPDGVKVCESLERAVKIARECEGNDNIMIIGGGEIYRQAITFADMIELTEVEARYDDADTFFPDILPSMWSLRELSQWKSDSRSGLRYRYLTLRRIKKQINTK